MVRTHQTRNPRKIYARNAAKMLLDHCVSQKWFNAPNAPEAALDLGVCVRKPKRRRVWVHDRA